MNTSSKVLSVVFVVLLAVAGAEFFYLFFNKPVNKSSPVINRFPTQAAKNTKDVYEQWVAGIPGNGGIDKSYIGFLVKKSPLKGEANYWVLEQVGTIKDVELNGKTPKGKPFDLRFTLVNDDSSKFDTYYFDIDKILEIYRINGDQKIKLTDFSEFKEGSKVKYIETNDLSKNINDKDAVTRVELDLLK